jgi:GNAT superfamily N-acetyltransferase
MNIRSAEPEDVPTIIALMREFAVFEGLLDHLEITEDRLSQVLFREGAFVNALVAEADGRVCAYSIFYPNFASFRGQLGMYLEDVYITADYRRKGIGDSMLREIARNAARRGFERIDFQVLGWNRSAIDFYKKLGAVRDDIERHFKFTDQAFTELAK